MKRARLFVAIAAACTAAGVLAGQPAVCKSLPSVAGGDLVMVDPKMKPVAGRVLDLGEFEYPSDLERQEYRVVTALGVSMDGHMRSGPYMNLSIDATDQACSQPRVQFRQVYFYLFGAEDLLPGVREERFDFKGDSEKAGPVRSPIERVRFVIHRSFVVASVHSAGDGVVVTLSNVGDRPTVPLSDAHPGTLSPWLRKDGCHDVVLKPEASCELSLRRGSGHDAGDLFLESGGESPLTLHVELGSSTPSAAIAYGRER